MTFKPETNKRANIAAMSALFALIRIVCIPVADYPDFSIVAPRFIESINNLVNIDTAFFSYIIDDSLASLCSVTPDELLYSFVFGGIYQCPLKIPSPFYFFISLILWFLLLFLVLFFIKLPKHSDKELKFIIRRTVIFIFAIPSTFYYVLNIHTDVPYSILSIAIVSYLMTSVYAGLNIYRISFFALAYACCLIFLFDNQIVISGTIVIVMLWLRSSRSKIFISLSDAASKISRNILSFRFRLLSSSYLKIGLLASLSYILFSFNQQVLSYLSNLNLFVISSTASSYSIHYSDVATKYNLTIRIFNTLQTFLIRTPAGFGVSMFSFILFIFSIFVGILRLFSSDENLIRPNVKLMVLFSIFFPIFAISVFTGFSNYKYWVALTPLFAMCMAFSYRLSIISLFFVYGEMCVRYLLSYLIVI